jgi:hypothetical protein
MCVNCLSTVDVAVWTSGGMAVAATNAWGWIGGRTRAAVGGMHRDRGGADDVAALFFELEQAPEAEARGTGVTGYAVALVVYVALGLLLKAVVVNWVVGPLFPLLLLGPLPAVAGRSRLAVARASAR